MLDYKIRLHSMLLILATTCLPVTAMEDGMSKTKSMDMNKLSKELVNPMGMNWNLVNNITVMHKEGDISDETGTAVQWLLQPVMPVLLNEETGLTLMNRPGLPGMLRQPVGEMDGTGQSTGIDHIDGIGDLTIQTSLGKMPSASFGMYMWGVGIDLKFPTASDDNTGSGKYSAGPAGMLVGFTKNYTFGAVASHVWSYAGDDKRADVNESQLQLLYYKQLGGGWQIGDNPKWTVDWDARSGDKYDMPIGLGLFKTTMVAGSAWRFGVTPRYYIKNHDSWGNIWAVNFTITPVIHNPFR